MPDMRMKKLIKSIKLIKSNRSQKYKIITQTHTNHISQLTWKYQGTFSYQ